MNEIHTGVKEELAFKDFSFFRSGGHTVYPSKMILAFLVGSHLGNNPVKFESHWPKGLGGDRFKANYLCFSIFSSGDQFVHRSETTFAILVQGHLSNISVKFE